MDQKIVKNDPLQTLKNFQGYYQCPTNENGIFLGPLVAYAGEYKDENEKTKNFVGDTYFNVAKVETYLATREYFAELMRQNLIVQDVGFPDKVVGMPMGGIKFSQTFGDIIKVPSIFAEKKILELANPEMGIKEKSDLIIARHEILPGEKVMIVEDLCNNFSTTRKAIKVVESFGATVTAIACVVNRSEFNLWEGLPVISAIFKPSPQYKQNDPKVAALVQSGNVVWKAKHFWDELKKYSKHDFN